MCARINYMTRNVSTGLRGRQKARQARDWCTTQVQWLHIVNTFIATVSCVRSQVGSGNIEMQKSNNCFNCILNAKLYLYFFYSIDVVAAFLRKTNITVWVFEYEASRKRATECTHTHTRALSSIPNTIIRTFATIAPYYSNKLSNKWQVLRQNW